MKNNKTYRINEALDKKIELDVKNKKILSILSANSRTPISTISKKIRLSKEGTFYRIKKLKEQNVLLKFYPVFDLRDFGYHTYHVFMVIDEVDPERKKELLNHLLEHKNTKSIMEYSDRWDLEWVMVARNVQDFDNILTDITKDFSDIIIEKHKFEIIFGYKSIQFPDPYYKRDVVLKTKKQTEKKIDKLSMEIIKILCEDVRLSTYKVSELIKLSPDAVSYRIKKLYDSGVIRQFSIMPNLSLLGYHWQTMCINLKTLDLNRELKFREYISAKPEIIRAVKVLGDSDLMLHIVTKKVKDWHRIVKDLHRTFVDIIVNYQIWSGYKEHYFTSLPKVVDVTNTL